ncbi:MAG: hypothetical protein FWG94_01710 [Oscillospiraceae bacterium]|nr:hypothetical protein [Oscillospiraceae bacterium]
MSTGDRIFKRSIRLLPALQRAGMSPIDALAVAYNATFLFYNMPHSFFLFSPKQILRRYSVSEIALMCENLLEPDGVEAGFNLNFKEAKL